VQPLDIGLLVLSRPPCGSSPHPPEERFLHERFGAPYDDNTRQVRRWL
jgi:hypothetical protein